MEALGEPSSASRRAVAIAAGGVAGAAVRWLVVAGVATSAFPWPVLALNVAGSLVLGAVLAAEWARPWAHVVLHDAAAIGFCGGLTTFSTFTLEVVDLVRDGRTATAAVYAAASVAGALGGIAAGAGLLRRIRAVTLPLEGRP